MGGKSKIDLLFDIYESERRKISNRQKPFYVSPGERSKFPSSSDGQFTAMIETTRGFKRFEDISERTLDKFLGYLGERTSKSVGGLVHKTIKTGFNVGIAFSGKNSRSSGKGGVKSRGGDFSGGEKNAEEERCGIVIEVYNASQPVEIYKIDENGKRHKAILNADKIKRNCSYNGKNFLNAYALRCKAGDLGNYVFLGNVKTIHKLERKPDKLVN